MEASSLLSKRYTLPSTSFVDPAIVTCTFAQNEQEHTSLSSSTTTQQTLVNDYEGDENATLTSPIITAQKVPSPQPALSTSLDHLWSKQEKYDDLNLRLFALEESEKWFEDRIRSLEKRQNHSPLNQQGEQLMKPTATQMNQSPDISQNHYMELYHSLLKKYNTLQKELETKEKLYKEKIQELTNTIASTTTKNDRKTSYKEENGYLLFDTTTMNGEITQCRIKIRMPCNRQQKSPASHASTISSPPARFTRIKPPPAPKNRY